MDEDDLDRIRGMLPPPMSQEDIEEEAEWQRFVRMVGWADRKIGDPEPRVIPIGVPRRELFGAVGITENELKRYLRDGTLVPYDVGSGEGHFHTLPGGQRRYIVSRVQAVLSSRN